MLRKFYHWLTILWISGIWLFTATWSKSQCYSTTLKDPSSPLHSLFPRVTARCFHWVLGITNHLPLPFITVAIILGVTCLAVTLAHWGGCVACRHQVVVLTHLALVLTGDHLCHVLVHVLCQGYTSSLCCSLICFRCTLTGAYNTQSFSCSACPDLYVMWPEIACGARDFCWCMSCTRNQTWGCVLASKTHSLNHWVIPCAPNKWFLFVWQCRK